ncbi:MAG TPA: hypothetical protein PK066_13715 [Saprospiraceae bacterium]|nr:hypothetical protein [Saprospiraceae bacterium]
MRKLILILILFIAGNTGFAQRGVMTFSVTEFKLPDSMAQQMDTLESRSGLPLQSMFKQIHLNVYFKPDFTRSEVTIMNGIVKLNYYWNRANNEVTLFSDVFGRRTKVKMDPMDVNALSADDIPEQDLHIQRFPEEHKTIMGLPVERVRVGSPDGPGIDLFVCPALKIPFVGYGIEQLTTDLLGGTPLGYRLQEGLLAVQFEVTKLENQVDESAFRLPGGYTEKSMEEYLKEFGSILH